MSKAVKVTQDSAGLEEEDTDHLDESRAGGEDVGTDGLVSLVLGLRFSVQKLLLTFLFKGCRLSMDLVFTIYVGFYLYFSLPILESFKL